MNKQALAAFAFAILTTASALPATAQSGPPCTAGPQCPTHETGSGESCGDQLGYMKRVYPAEVLGVDNHYRVWVTELCPSDTLMRSDGNAAYLRSSIAKNRVLVEVLGRQGFHADDVVAVRMMGDDTVNLYVHHFGKL